VVGTILARSDSPTQVSNLLSQVASAVPGFDIETKTPRLPFHLSPVAFLGLLAIAAAIGVSIGTDRLEYGVIAGLATLVLLCYIAEVVHTPARVMAKALMLSPMKLDGHPYDRFRTAAPRKSGTTDALGGQDAWLQGSAGAMPARSSITIVMKLSAS